jgi:hypothetical protein
MRTNAARFAANISDSTLPCAALLALALVISIASCSMTPPTAKAAGVNFSTKPQALPAAIEWVSRSRAHEVLNPVRGIVVLSGGANPIPDDRWESFQPPFPWQKNIERNLLFQESAFLNSPGAPAGERTFITMGGYTWVVLVKAIAVDYIPQGEKVDLLRSAPGHLVVKTIQKAQVLRWDGPAIYQLTDNRGNYYVMHAYEDSAGPTTDVSLPAGWSLRKVEIAEPLVIAPSESGYYNIVGDCLGQGYHQYIFAGPVWPSY